MSLLWDQNLSPRLAGRLADLFPGSVHVRDVGLASATDDQVWSFALEHGHAIVSKDADFMQRSVLCGPPPKAIWIRCGNCSTAGVEKLIRQHHRALQGFLADETTAFLALGPLAHEA